ncbi:MAG TPA: peroxiredoxin [Thermoanaerobaculia bacterium]|nr:peroxiredoxin [Thermoanaerobaculia bacterium]
MSKTMIAALLLALAVPFAAIAADAPTQPAAGSAAPSFKLSNQEGSPVSLADYKGKWVVLYFYPKDFTAGCTIEAHNFQRDLGQYTEKNAVVLGVSLDTVDSHKSFCTKEALNFKLLADTDKTVTTQYGSTMVHDGTTYAARNTFLIDPAGVIRKVYVGVKAAHHSEEILADLAALQATK